MKRSWIGFGLLVLLLVVATVTTVLMVRAHQPIGEDLTRAAQCAAAGDWAGAQACFQKARNRWDRWEHFRATLADHTPVEEIDAEFALLEVYCLAREDAAFAAECRALSQKVAAVGEAHEFVWWNLL